MGGPAHVDGHAVKHTDNFYLRAPMVVNGQAWPTCEHYFQAMKFADATGVFARATSRDDERERLDYQEKIRKAESPGASWALGQTRGVRLRRDWELVKGHIMYEGVKAKYEQYPELAAELVATRGPIRAAPSTADWQRKNSAILERVREELRPAAERDDEKLKELVSIIEPAYGVDDVASTAAAPADRHQQGPFVAK